MERDRLKLVAALSIVVSALLAVWLYTERTAFQITGSGSGSAYLIDRRTGQAWFLAGEEKRRVYLFMRPGPQKSSKRKTIEEFLLEEPETGK